MKVSILGTEYSIEKKKYDEEPVFEKRDCNGYCMSLTKSIVICDMSSYKGWEKDPPEIIAAAERQALRHEIVHAFFDESGLQSCSLTYEGSWPENEELVDWIANQGEKIYEAWKQTGCLDN